MKTNKSSTPKKRSTVPMIAGIVLPIFLIGGIVMIIIGAINHIWALLGVGIAMVVAGFYGTPFAWMSFSSNLKYDHIVKIVMVDHILNVNSISIHADLKPNDVVIHLKRAIRLGDLKGLTLIGNELQSISAITHPNADEVFDLSGKDDVEFDLVCPYCGGTTPVTNKRRARCQYCGRMISDKK